uniref:Uncharacterized protein n=1 Tax=Tetranychus urticae TaxID=32264 RepID=T1K584_TETUR
MTSKVSYLIFLVSLFFLIVTTYASKKFLTGLLIGSLLGRQHEHAPAYVYYPYVHDHYGGEHGGWW